MSLTRSKAEKLGLAFDREGETYPSDPDQEIWSASLTADGHTFTFTGKSADDLLVQAETVLKNVGRLDADEPDVANNEKGENQVAQEDILSKDQLLPLDAADEDHPTIEEGVSA